MAQNYRFLAVSWSQRFERRPAIRRTGWQEGRICVLLLHRSELRRDEKGQVCEIGALVVPAVEEK